jgi:hypothetical protein
MKPDWGITRLEKELSSICIVDPGTWSHARVCSWLESKKYGHLVPLFSGVDGSALMGLSLAQLRDEVMVESLRDRIGLMHEVLMLKTAEEMPDGVSFIYFMLDILTPPLTPEGSISSGASPAPPFNSRQKPNSKDRANKAISTFSISDYLTALEDLDKEIPPIPPFSTSVNKVQGVNKPQEKSAIIIDHVLLTHELHASPKGISGKIEKFARRILDTPLDERYTGSITPIIPSPESEALFSETLVFPAPSNPLLEHSNPGIQGLETPILHTRRLLLLHRRRLKQGTASLHPNLPVLQPNLTYRNPTR